MATVTGRKAPSGFQKMHEGRQTLKCVAITGKPRDDIKLVEAQFVNAQGEQLGTEKFPYKYDLDTDGGWAAFYFLLKNGLGVDLNEGDQFNLDDMVGKFFDVDIIHKEGTKARDDGTYPVFVNIRETFGPGQPFDTTASTGAAAPAPAVAAAAPSFD